MSHFVIMGIRGMHEGVMVTLWPWSLVLQADLAELDQLLEQKYVYAARQLPIIALPDADGLDAWRWRTRLKTKDGVKRAIGKAAFVDSCYLMRKLDVPQWRRFRGWLFVLLVRSCFSQHLLLQETWVSELMWADGFLRSWQYRPGCLV